MLIYLNKIWKGILPKIGFEDNLSATLVKQGSAVQVFLAFALS